MGKKELLARIVNCCEVRFSRENATNWKHSDFIDLAREILRDTDVNISPNTLKRIFGKLSVDDDYLPQQATIEALMKYGRCTPIETELLQPAQPLPQEPIVINTPAQTKSYKWYGILAAVLIIIVSLIVLKIRNSKQAFSGTIQLTTIEGILPATAFFNLQLPNTEDSIFINFGDKSPLAYVAAGQKNTSHNYLFPGVFQVALQTKQHILDTATAYIRSNKWIGLGFHRQADLPDHYYAFPALRTGTDSFFTITNSQLSKVGLDTTGSIYTRLCNFTDVGSTSEDFVFETSFKNAVKEKGIYCNSTQFQISGKNGLIRFKLVSPGCSSWVLNIVSEQRFEGKTINLSQFVTNLEQWNTVRLTNKDKHVMLFVNNKLLFDGKYQTPLGVVKGLFLEFEGTGFVKTCRLTQPSGKILYQF